MLSCSLSRRSASVSKTCLLYPGPLWQHRWTKRSILQIFLAYLRVGFEFLTAVVMKSSIFWDITPCSPLKVNWRFGGTCRLHLQGRKISRARNQRESRWQADPEDGGDMFLRNVGWNSTDYTASYPRRWYSLYPQLWIPQILQKINIFGYVHCLR
jgi:hypothetical protein